MSKILGIDYGKARIGLALSDEKKILAFPLTCVKAHYDLKKTAQEIATLVSSTPCEQIVIGLPLLMNGKDSDLTKEVRLFASLLGELVTQPIV